MFKLLLVSVILSQNLFFNICAAPATESLPDAPELISPWNSESNSTNIDNKTLFPGNYNFYAAHQNFYLIAADGLKGAAGLSVDNVGKKIRADYIVRSGIGPYKAHRWRLSWNNARKICVEEGGHLAIIRSDAEEKIIRQIIGEASLGYAWVGYHDQFEEGNWITVLDEPIAAILWTPWSSKIRESPNNEEGQQNCACLITSDDSGLNDDECARALPFVCKISFS